MSTSHFLQHVVTTVLPIRPIDATLSVTKAARLLGVHPNTIRAWSDQGRLRYYRINPRGDRRYRLGDLQGFLAAAEAGLRGDASLLADGGGRSPMGSAILDQSAETRPEPETLADERHHVSRIAPGGRRPRGRRIARGGFAARFPTTIAMPLAGERHRLDLRVLAELAGLAATGRDLEAMLQRAVGVLRDAYGYHVVAAYEHREDGLALRAAAYPPHGHPIDRSTGSGTPERALADQRPTLARLGDADWLALANGSVAEIAVPITSSRRPWGVLVVASDDVARLTLDDVELLVAVARQFAAVVHSAGLLTDASRQVHRLDALRRVAGDIASRLDLEQALAALVDHAMVLFGADRAAVVLRRPDR